jgi:hypothetical protein
MSFQAGVDIEKENYHYDQRHHRPLFCRLGVPRRVPINRHAVSLQSTMLCFSLGFWRREGKVTESVTAKQTQFG